MRRHIIPLLICDLDVNDFSLTITGGTATFSGGLSTATPTSITKTSTSVWVLGLPLSGRANGNEKISVNAASATSIYDINGNASPASQSGTNNKANLNQSTGLIITNVAIDTDNTTLTVTFNEAAHNTANGTGDLDVNDFSLTITGGTATFSGGSSGSSTATPTSINKGSTASEWC